MLQYSYYLRNIIRGLQSIVNMFQRNFLIFLGKKALIKWMIKMKKMKTMKMVNMKNKLIVMNIKVLHIFKHINLMY